MEVVSSGISYPLYRHFTLCVNDKGGKLRHGNAKRPQSRMPFHAPWVLVSNNANSYGVGMVYDVVCRYGFVPLVCPSGFLPPLLHVLRKKSDRPLAK